MSTITVTHASAVPTTRLRLTTRGRRVLAALAAAPIVLAIAIGAISGGSAIASSDHGAAEERFVTVTVAAGDTLWGIASAVAGDADVRDVVIELASLNGLQSTDVTPGQELSVPATWVAAAAD